MPLSCGYSLLSSLAANKARVPSILITNFTFDSIYSLLSAPFVDQCHSQHLVVNPTNSADLSPEPDFPIPEEDLSPLVRQISDGYRHADLLLVLPGAIPIPSFAITPSLPATQWIDPISRTFKPEVVEHLVRDPCTYTLHRSMPFPASHPGGLAIAKPRPRRARPAPLLVRPPNDGVCTPEGRSHFLSSIGIPDNLHDPATTKILIVSFGGQTFHKPSRSHTPSHTSSPYRPRPEHLREQMNGFSQELAHKLNSLSIGHSRRNSGHASGPSHIFVPGAPAPAAVPSPTLPTFTTIPPTPTFSDFGDADTAVEQEDADARNLMLPDASWIAVVCGVADSREWQTKRHNADSSNTSSGEEDGDLPDGFYIAPRDVYMPDLMAVGDVLLGKLVRLPSICRSTCGRACTHRTDMPRVYRWRGT